MLCACSPQLFSFLSMASAFAFDCSACVQQMSGILVNTLSRVLGDRGQEPAYVQLSIILPCFWSAPGTSVAQIMAAGILNSQGMPHMLRLAQVSARMVTGTGGAKLAQGSPMGLPEEHVCSGSTG
jgi:hypothetical protein